MLKEYKDLILFTKDMEQRQAVIKNADMSDDMQQDAVDIASQAISKYNIEKVCFCNVSQIFDWLCDLSPLKLFAYALKRM